ncbi:ArsR/SmtB family transcription factor [Dyella koreensis]|uniref:Helix-turn-helix transcriptional regulator n=1 Tax=Dyella koreensis TaxID=311235 RepID=A0ABW8K7D0_9GAMM
MKPLVHPSIDDVTVEGILHALADPVRVAIYAEMAGSACALNCSTFQKVSDRDIPKSTLSQHFRALREAGLIRSERRGVEMHNTTRCTEIERRFPGLLAGIMNAYKAQVMEKARKAGRKPSSRKTA